ncbi:MAG: chalcone isomerase family protein [Burkholderiaceae bacterium]
MSGFIRLTSAGTCVLALLAPVHAATVEREGMRYEDVIRLGGSKVVLNGVGVRGGNLFQGYVAGLYLPRKETDADQIYVLEGAKRIAVRMLLGVNSGVLAKSFSDGIRKNYKDEALEPLLARMDVFDGQVRAVGGVKKGDEIDLDFVPANGTRLLVNGKPQGDAIVGDDFYVALLKMFIGERAVDKGLRAALLGQPQ